MTRHPSLLFFAAPLLLAGCASMECAWGTHLDGRICVPGATATLDGPIDTGDLSGPHPLVPEEFQWIWNTDACEPEHGGGTGHQVYAYLHEATVDASGHFEGEERWYWFFAEPGWAQDCYDTFEVTGEPTTLDMGSLGCSECDEAYEIRRELVESGCGMSYRWLLSSCAVGDGYCSVVLLDTLTPSGNPNVDNKLLAFTVPQKDGTYNGRDIDTDWGKGHIFPQTDNYGPPADYDWVAPSCQRAW